MLSTNLDHNSSMREKVKKCMAATTSITNNNTISDRHSNINDHADHNTDVSRSRWQSGGFTNRSVLNVLVIVLVSSWCLSSCLVMAKSLNMDTVDNLAVPDHLDGVKMEQDGHLNQRFRQEIFMGDLEDLDELPYEARRAKLDEVFEKADVDNDQYLDLKELEEWIQRKLEEHLDEATNETDKMFTYLDSNKDGFVQWEEYFRKYLEARGYNKPMIDNYVRKLGSVDFNETLLEYIPLKRNEDRAILMRYQNRWFDADEDTQDNKLTKEEFLKFRHPEHREDSTLEMAESILNSLDKNRNEKLTVDEFIALPPGIVSETEAKDDRQWQDERKYEFENYIDSNKDGIVDVVELKHYLNPRNPVQIKNEAVAILEMIDDNNDKHLSKQEVLHHESEFISSKMVEIARNFHDEF
ncbi:45 kDa calcium-binding protein-like [Octopus vulgaris]|uniref:45 kDa calcium-binding protein n=1 Tax=Octopus vulgaris TaxID=6645 RepID=A0AA36BVU3_OCTVU|nr:45 kDa calcium-binding protein-like [Octopus vulgaris]